MLTPLKKSAETSTPPTHEHELRKYLNSRHHDPSSATQAAANDGTFWMSFDDFKQHFVSISVCMAHVPQPASACGADGVPKKKAKDLFRYLSIYE